MVAGTIAQFTLYLILLAAATPLVGRYMAGVFSGGRNWLSPIMAPLEAALYRLCGIRADQEQHWTAYAGALVMFSLLGTVLLYGLLRLQALLPLNPAGLAPMSEHLAFNTAVSFVTNTNWQSYGGETSLSHFSQMIGLSVQNFASAAVGLAVAVALTRGFARRSAQSIGHFIVDVTRAVLYVLLPLCLIIALVHVWQGVPQNFAGPISATTLEGAQQAIAQGPVASQMAIKHLGTNGGGFFNANAAHPYENPTPLNNLVVLLSILLIPSALTNCFGHMVGNVRQGWALWAAMTLLFLAGFAIVCWQEAAGNPWLAQMGVGLNASDLSPGGNMEGKDLRFGITGSALFAVITTIASCGAVNAMHDSFSALGGMVPLLNIMLGEVIYGGVGAGLYGMLVFVMLTVFIAGLMVGRTPEYLGKKIEAREIKLAMLTVLVFPIGILAFGALAAVLPAGLAGVQDPGPHGLTEILYAYTSATGNNGSAFAGFTANTPYHNSMLAVAMLLGRFAVILPLLAVAGSLAAKKTIPVSSGTFPTDSGLFVGLLIGVILIVGGLTFFPVLALGPIAEHLAVAAGQLFGA